MNREFNGETAVYGVIGDPVSHSLSPQIHGYFAGLCKKGEDGVNMAYVPFHVKGDELAYAIKGAHSLGIRGLNVTLPHKRAVMPYCVSIDSMAQKVQSVNTLLWAKDGYIGYNTDYIGIKRTVAALNMTFKDCHVAVLGAGGSAYAAVIAAADGGAGRITIINRTVENAVSLASHVKTYYNMSIKVDTFGTRLKSNPDIVIQTTTIGFGEAKDKSPITDYDFFRGVKLAFDIIYTPKETVFLCQAKEAGVPAIANGFPMLVYQAAAAFGLWHKKIPDEEAHIKILAEGLYSN